ncbi:MAG: hypothetical protein MUE71_04735 [Chitinophagaceae bacterium]|jgi:hypothetical protein|nr:hypothetical protein [Chitinophagaceae bacterium]
MVITPENRNNMAAAKPGEVNPMRPDVYQSTNFSDSLGRSQLANYISATQKMQPALVAHLADSICKAHGVVIFSKENKPVDLKKASEAGELVLMKGEVVYLPTGASSRRLPAGKQP